MNKSLTKLALTLVLNLIISIPVYARLLRQEKLQFPIKTDELMKGDILFYTEVLSPRKMATAHPELFEIDSLSLMQEPESEIVISKSVYVVNKPVGFFDDKQLSDEKFVAHMSGDQKIKKVAPDTFRITVPGEFAQTYKLQMFFDADDVSTLPNSKITRAVDGAKKLDIISQGASSIMFVEQTQFSKFLIGAVSVTSYIPLKEEKTLVIQYHLKALKKNVVSEKKIKVGLEDEMMATRDYLESYK